MAEIRRYDIISDTHGYLTPELLDALQGADVIVHAGDICSPTDFRTLQLIAPVQACLGNNDYASDYPPTVRARKVFYGSGLKWQVSHYRERLNLSLCDVAICGHTHTPFLERDEWTGTLVMNPGSPTAPRRSRPSMGRILCEEGRVIDAQIITLR